jgi:hypothetical protein
MNNERADMFHDLVCEHRKLSDAHSKLQLELSQKGKLNRHIHICRMPCLFSLSFFYLLPAHPNMPAHNLYRHSAAGAEAQVTELAKRVKELTGMPDLANFPLNLLCFKSFSLLPLFFYLQILLTSNFCR